METGVLGERLPLKVTNVAISGNCTECNFTWKGDSSIEFTQGNYTISYQGPIRDNHLQGTFDTPYNVTVILPPAFSVKNPLLAGLSHGALVQVQPDNSTQIQWNKITSFVLRSMMKTENPFFICSGISGLSLQLFCSSFPPHHEEENLIYL
jgi:hypothetical protein